MTRVHNTFIGENVGKAPGEFDKSSCRITVAGDILWHEPLMKLCDANGIEGYREPFLGASETLLDTDFLVGNPETVFSAEDSFTNERYCFNTPPAALKALKKTGFDLLTFANNHIMDRGTNGIRGTISACQSEQMDYIGITDDKNKADDIYVREINGIKVSFVNFTYGTNAFAHRRFLHDDEKYMVNLLQPEETTDYAIDLLQSPDKIENDVKEIYTPAREQEKTYLHRFERIVKKAKEQSEFVIALLHTGGQYNTEPDAFSKLIAERAANAGADCILCNHPHILLPSKFENGVFTTYGYGNFQAMLRGDCKINPDYNAAVKIHLTKDGSGKVSAKYSFVLYKTVIENKMLFIKNTYDLLAEQNNDKALEKEILFYASLFAGVQPYTKAQKEYAIL